MNEFSLQALFHVILQFICVASVDVWYSPDDLLAVFAFGACPSTGSWSVLEAFRDISLGIRRSTLLFVMHYYGCATLNSAILAFNRANMYRLREVHGTQEMNAMYHAL